MTLDTVRAALTAASNAADELEADDTAGDRLLRELSGTIDDALAVVNRLAALRGPAADEAALDAHWEARISEALGK